MKLDRIVLTVLAATIAMGVIAAGGGVAAESTTLIGIGGTILVLAFAVACFPLAFAMGYLALDRIRNRKRS